MSTKVIIAFGFGVIFVISLLLLAIFFPNPTPFQYNLFRIILSLAAAGVAAMIPGFIKLNLSANRQLAIRAGGALAVFVIVYFFNPAQLAIQSSTKEISAMSISAAIQEYHIIRGATASPMLLPTITGAINDIETLQQGLWEQVFAVVDTAKQHVDLHLSIDGSQLRVSHYVELWLPGIGIQGMGAARKVLDADLDRPIDLDKLFAGEYPGNYFRSGDTMTIGLEGRYGRYQSEQVVVHRVNSGYSFSADVSAAATQVTLRRRPATVLVDDFEAAGRSSGAGQDIALQLKNYLRTRVEKEQDLKLSPLSRAELQSVHNEVKDLPLHPMKGFQVAEYNVDYIVYGTIVLK